MAARNNLSSRWSPSARLTGRWTRAERRCVLLCIAVIVIGLATRAGTTTPGQKKAERFWLAGRYDGGRVVVYFDAVKFAGTKPTPARTIASPVAIGFLIPEELPASYISRFQRTANAEHFAVGDRYDLLLGNGAIATIKLTTLVGFENDEAVGNDSYIGALATVEPHDSLIFTKGYYAVRSHQQSRKEKPGPKSPAHNAKHAGLMEEPIRFDLETQVAELLNLRMKMETTTGERSRLGNVPPAFEVQAFRVADGSLRYYVRAGWKSGKAPKDRLSYAMAAWMTPLPKLRILAVESRHAPYGGIVDALPNLLNVVDLGGGRTGIIVYIIGEDSTELRLAEYRDGVNLGGMPVLQYLGCGE